jgi:microcystin-dependent protein
MMKSFKTAIASAVLAFSIGGTAAAQECFIGEVRYFAGNFTPRNWAIAQGQLLPINQNQALFSIIGTFYGGDGRTTFALPDLRGRFAVGPGQGPGLSNFSVGQKGGAETATLNTNNLPPHSHNLQASTNAGTSGTPGGNVLANTGRDAVYGAAGAMASMGGSSIGTTGAGQAFSTRDPYLAINPIICLQGYFPSRN